MNNQDHETAQRGADSVQRPCSAEWLWADIVAADVDANTITVRLRDERPTVMLGDAARICVRLHQPKGNASRAFEELKAAAQGAFDKIEDVDLFAKRLREGDAP